MIAAAALIPVTTALLTTALLTTALLTTGQVTADRRRRGTGIAGP
jgi:hypothetical protein